MKYILFERSAIKAMLNNKFLQTTEFQTGLDFATAIFNNDKMEIDIPNVKCKTLENGYLFIGKEAGESFITLDLEQTSVLRKATKEEFIKILQKLFRFATRYWLNSPLTILEKIIPGTSKAVVFPFPISRNSENSFRLTIDREPRKKRSEKRGLKKLLLVCEYGDSNVSQQNDTDFETKIFDLSMEKYLQYRFEIKNEFELEKEKMNEKKSNSVQIIESSQIGDCNSYYLPFHKWNERLTISQKKFIHDVSDKKPIRIEGPAGTGKTLALILKAIYLLKKAEEENKECRLLFITHSRATQNSTKIIFETISEETWQDSEKQQSINITTLHEFCIETLAQKITADEILDRDAYDSKEYQFITIMDSFDRVMESAFITFKMFLSPELSDFLSNTQDKAEVCKLLQHEFAVQIKGHAENDKEKYVSLPSLKTGLPIQNEEDKSFIYRIFTDYQDTIEAQHVYDTDDIVISAMTSFDNPIWRRKRKNEGFDYVFIDETHLFNTNEKNLFHYLTKDANKIAINFSIDITQAMGEQGVSKENLHNHFLENTDLNNQFDVVFRCSSYITDLAMSITASGSRLFDNFINPYKETTTAFTENDDSKVKKPSYKLFDNDREMLSNTVNSIKEIKNDIKCSESEIAIVAFSDVIFKKLEKILIESNVKFKIIQSRGDLETKNQAKKDNSFILSLPEFIGGLEFNAVLLVGVDAGRVPPKNINDISKNYLKYSAYNKLYVSITRAKYQLEILGSHEFGTSPCLDYPVNQNILEVIK